ncbi:cytochrome c3 family protein, partial [Thermodesulfobacteriota bacterium]
FYVKQQKRMEIEWPGVIFDYYIHDKHDKALEQKCELCHYISPALEKKIAGEGREPACLDWLMEVEPGRSLTVEEEAHPRCINCHLERKAEKKDTGPLACKECHTGTVRPVDDMAQIARPECDQKERMLIQLEEGARMKGAAFDHAAHQARTQGCQDCHHDTLQACGKCHGPQGTEDGGFVSLAEAYHEPASGWSCVGCHEQEKGKPDCAGCHHLMQSGLVESACSTCHSGTLDSLDGERVLADPKTLLPEDVKDEMEIALLEEEYGPSKLTHLAIASKLTEISNNSKLAAYFHTDAMTVCIGCHHFGPVEKSTTVPQCVACHTARKEPQRQTPTLLGAYHQQCLGCHRQMGGTEEKMPQDCEGCHEEKEVPKMPKVN